MKQVIALSAALVLSLMGSYLAWTDESEEVGADEVELYSANEDSVTKLTWESDKASIVAERRSDPKGTYVWITATERNRIDIEPEPSDTDHPDDEPAAEEPEEPTEDDPHAGLGLDLDKEDEVEGVDYRIEATTRAFKGNSAADKLWTGFAPLVALRELKPQGEVDRATFGLDEPEGTVEVTRSSGPVSLDVGGESYGTQDRYVGYNGKIFLIDDGTLKPLEFASSRLLERTLQPIAEPELERVTVALPDGGSFAYTQQNRDDRDKAYWALADSPDSADDAADTWIPKVLRMRLKEYADMAEAPADLQPVVRIEVAGDGQVWVVELLSGPDDTFYARSDFTRALVTLTPAMAGNVIDDLGSLSP